jgi:DNA-binding MarR family transcriptional regulator
LTAPDSGSNSHAAAHTGNAAELTLRRVDQACQAAIEGRRSIRALSQWCEIFALSDSEFQVLWLLRLWAPAGADQTRLARHLAFSPAQVSALIEKLRSRGWIEPEATEDRRRRIWHLAPGGGDLMKAMLGAATELHMEMLSQLPLHSANEPQREAA